MSGRKIWIIYTMVAILWSILCLALYLEWWEGVDIGSYVEGHLRLGMYTEEEAEGWFAYAQCAKTEIALRASLVWENGILLLTGGAVLWNRRQRVVQHSAS
jgi:hypothetical protein